MEVYLVGGAVRDELLGLVPRERDWVVVGATPADMERLGYRPVGRDFPVFLHPETQEEYALARLERKVAPGYRGFQTDFSPSVTLLEDLQRRDLTINAIARRTDGTLIDPCGGVADLHARRLCHISPAFAEDPVRILRAARFLARFAPLGFALDHATLLLMQQMVARGEAAALVPERVWRELERALAEPAAPLFFKVLDGCGALAVVMPEIAALLLQPPQAREALQSLSWAATAARPVAVRLAALLAGLDEVAAARCSERLRLPAECSELLQLAVRIRPRLHIDGHPLERAVRDAEWLLALFDETDAYRRRERFTLWLQVFEARALANHAPPAEVQALMQHLQNMLDIAATVRLTADDLVTRRGPQIGARLRELRLATLGDVLGQNRN